MKASLLRCLPWMCVAAFTASLPVAAQTPVEHNSHHPAQVASPKASAAEAEWADGEVRRIDPEAGKVTLRHGEIRSLDMPPMTMVFHADKALLGRVKVGDTVRFKAVQEAGKYMVTDMQAKP